MQVSTQHNTVMVKYRHNTVSNISIFYKCTCEITYRPTGVCKTLVCVMDEAEKTSYQTNTMMYDISRNCFLLNIFANVFF